MPDRWLTDTTPSEPFPVYTRAGAAEVMAGPCSPLGWTLVWEQAIGPGWRDASLAVGQGTPVCASFGGYLYLSRAGLGADAAARLADPGGEPGDGARIAAQRDRADAARRSRTDLTYLTPAELVERARGLLPLLREAFAAKVAADRTAPADDDGSAAASLALWHLSRMAAESPDLGLYFDGGVPGILERLDGSPSDDAKAFLDAFDTLLNQHGFHGPDRWDLRAEVWETSPELALDRLEELRRRPDGDPTGVADAAAEARQQAGANAGKVVHEIRMAVREIGRQVADANHVSTAELVMMLTADELDDFVAQPATYGLKLADRARDFATLAGLDPPALIEGTVPPLSTWPRRTG